MAGPRKILNCLVCRVQITHAHMGVDSCRACGVFYRRTLKLKYRLECTCGGKDITRKDTIVSCRKCRFEKMRELVNRATAGEISCVVDGEFDCKQSIEISCGTSEISLQEIHENDVHLDSNESNENNSATDEIPSFIDHNSYFDYEPSCSDTPLLNKMESAYSTMCLVRKSCEFNGLHHLEMHAQLRNEEMALRYAKSSNMIPFSQIFFVSIIDFAKSAFPAFSKMSTEDRNALVQTNFPLIQSLDGSYRSNHNFPNEDAVMTSYTTFVSHDTLDIFFKECPSVENKDEAKETFRMNMERTIKSTKFQFGKVNPSKEEFVALFGLALWNDCTSTLSIDTSDLISTIRKDIMMELSIIYKRKGIANYASRLGELLCLLANEEACVQFPAKNNDVEKVNEGNNIIDLVNNSSIQCV